MRMRNWLLTFVLVVGAFGIIVSGLWFAPRIPYPERVTVTEEDRSVAASRLPPRSSSPSFPQSLDIPPASPPAFRPAFPSSSPSFPQSLDIPPASPPAFRPAFPSSSPPPPHGLGTVDEALENLRAANVAFNTPDKARVGKQFIVEAKLSTHLHPEEMKVLIGEPGKREVATLKVSDRMVATLSGGSAFDVSPSGPKEQWISDKELTEWDWQITPKSVGEQILILSFDAIISVNGKEDRRTINTFKRRINVDVGWPETVGEWLEFIKKTGENVSWIWATLLIPIGGGIWAWIKHRAWLSKPTGTDLS
jgi:hypothetical protein